MIILPGKDKKEFTQFIVESVNHFTAKEGAPLAVGISLSELEKKIAIHYNKT